MKIQLFNPPVNHYADVHYRMNPALGLPILAAVLERAGHDARVWDLEAMKLDPQKLAAAFDKQQDNWPDAVGFTVTAHNQRGARECIDELRGIGYKRRIVVGGPQVTVEPGCLPDATAAVTGECEGNVVEIFADGRGVVKGQPMPIADIPNPLWSKHTPRPTEYYGNLPKVGHPEGISMWSRGCPHDCIFCANPVFGHQRIRHRPPVAIHDDMAALRALGVRSVFVYDDELVGLATQGQNNWLAQVCKQIEPLGLTWKCQGRCNERLTLDVLQAMHAAGCRAIMWGVESFSDRVLKAIHKHTTEDDIWHTLRLARKAGIGNWLFLMVGNYQETPDDLKHTEAQLQHAIEEGLVQWRQVTVCTPVQGTKLYELAQQEGWLVEAPEGGPQMAQAYLSTPWLSKREIGYWRGRLMAA